MLGEGFNVSEACWNNLPHCSTGEPLPQLDLPACIPSMSHQPVALFTFKDPNLLAPPEFMTPCESGLFYFLTQRNWNYLIEMVPLLLS